MVELMNMLYFYAAMCSAVHFLSDIGVTTATAAVSSPAPRSPRTSWIHPSRASKLTRAPLAVRGGSVGTDDGTEDETENDDALSPSSRDYRSFMQQAQPPHGGGISSDNSRQENKPAERIEKIAADLKARRDDIAADVRARGEAIAADLKAKQAKIADEVLRDRSPEAFGELGGHRSYDSATAGVHVANRRSLFLGVRRLILLAQVVELVVACAWQALFPHGGIAGLIAAGEQSWTTPDLGDGSAAAKSVVQGRLSLAISAALGQGALYTILFVFFGCDRVVLKAVRLTGWEHGAAAAWIMFRAMKVADGGWKISKIMVSMWLAAVAALCGYFGRQL